MVEIKEVVRLWRAGIKKKRIASQLMLDVKTVRRYVAAAEECGLVPGPEPPLDDEQLAKIVAALSPDTGRPRGDGWLRCEAERDAIEKLLAAGVGDLAAATTWRQRRPWRRVRGRSYVERAVQSTLASQCPSLVGIVGSWARTSSAQARTRYPQITKSEASQAMIIPVA